jgi:hypothetical protein
MNAGDTEPRHPRWIRTIAPFVVLGLLLMVGSVLDCHLHTGYRSGLDDHEQRIRALEAKP